MRHKLCRSFHPWCLGVKTRCLFSVCLGWKCVSVWGWVGDGGMGTNHWHVFDDFGLHIQINNRIFYGWMVQRRKKIMSYILCFLKYPVHGNGNKQAQMIALKLWLSVYSPLVVITLTLITNISFRLTSVDWSVTQNIILWTSKTSLTRVTHVKITSCLCPIYVRHNASAKIRHPRNAVC